MREAFRKLTMFHRDKHILKKNKIKIQQLVNKKKLCLMNGNHYKIKNSYLRVKFSEYFLWSYFRRIQEFKRTNQFAKAKYQH